MNESIRWIGRELRAADKTKLETLLEEGHPSETLFLRAALARETRWDNKVDGERVSAAPTEGTWWWGVFRDGTKLQGVMYVDNHEAFIYVDSEQAARGFADELYATQKRVSSFGAATQRHQLWCESKMMHFIWPVLKDIPNRKLVSDRDCELLLAQVDDEIKPPSSRTELTLAERSEARTVSDFLGEYHTEVLGTDPRKLTRDLHARRVLDAVAQGRALLGKERDTKRPFFAGELTMLDEDTIFLKDAYTPTHFRSRGRMLAQAFWDCARVPIGERKLLCLTSEPALAQAAKAAGWKSLARYRWIVALG